VEGRQRWAGTTDEVLDAESMSLHSHCPKLPKAPETNHSTELRKEFLIDEPLNAKEWNKSYLTNLLR